MIRMCVLATALSVAAFAPHATAAQYTATMCGFASQYPGDACYVARADTVPTPADTSGLNNNLFSAFFTSHGIAAVGGWHWDARGVNAGGYVFGDVWDDIRLATTQFVYRAGQVLCCTVDFPYRLNGLNDNGVYVGQNGDGSAALGNELLPHAVTFALPDLLAASVDFLLSASLDAIDNDGRISGATFAGERFLLAPVTLDTAVAAVPEPSGATLLVAALAGLWARRRVSL